MKTEELGFVAIVVKDNWHLATGTHFGDVLYDYRSTSRVFIHEMDAIENAFNILKEKYPDVKPVSSKGLQQKYDNELDDNGRELHIICFPVYY